MLPVREGRLQATDTARLFQESTPHLRRALKKVYAHDGSAKLAAAATAVAPVTLRLPICAKYLLLAAHLACALRTAAPNPTPAPTQHPPAPLPRHLALSGAPRPPAFCVSVAQRASRRGWTWASSPRCAAARGRSARG